MRASFVEGTLAYHRDHILALNADLVRLRREHDSLRLKLRETEGREKKMSSEKLEAERLCRSLSSDILELRQKMKDAALSRRDVPRGEGAAHATATDGGIVTLLRDMRFTAGIHRSLSIFREYSTLGIARCFWRWRDKAEKSVLKAIKITYGVSVLCAVLYRRRCVEMENVFLQWRMMSYLRGVRARDREQERMLRRQIVRLDDTLSTLRLSDHVTTALPLIQNIQALQDQLMAANQRIACHKLYLIFNQKPHITLLQLFSFWRQEATVSKAGRVVEAVCLMAGLDVADIHTHALLWNPNAVRVPKSLASSHRHAISTNSPYHTSCRQRSVSERSEKQAISPIGGVDIAMLTSSITKSRVDFERALASTVRSLALGDDQTHTQEQVIDV